MDKQKTKIPLDARIFLYIQKKRRKVILFSFIFSLIIFIISLLISNKGGYLIIVLYPIALISFIDKITIKKWGERSTVLCFPIFIMVIAILAFILGFFEPFNI